MSISRRNFLLQGTGLVIAAPAIVRATSLDVLRGVPLDPKVLVVGLLRDHLTFGTPGLYLRSAFNSFKELEAAAAAIGEKVVFPPNYEMRPLSETWTLVKDCLQREIELHGITNYQRFG